MQKMIQLIQSQPPKYDAETLINKTSENINLLGDSLYEIISTVIKQNKDNMNE